MTTDKSSEREPTTRVKTFDDKTLVVEAATGAVIKNYHPRLTSMAVAFHEGIEYARAALPQQAQEPSLPPQGAASPDPQLLKFYAVSDYPSLVAAMLRHIEKLQSKLPKDGQPLLTRVRA